MLKVESLTVTARLTHGINTIVSGLSFNAETGEVLAIAGQSGCGKTMTALAIFGLLPENCAASGFAAVDGVDMLRLTERELTRLRGRTIVYLPQSGADFLNPSLKISVHFYETLRRLGTPRDRRRETALSLLGLVGFPQAEEIINKYPFQLSGGMAQRVVLALGLAGQPKLVIADEPTRGIDRDSALEFIRLLKTSFPHSAVIVITHDITIARLCDKLLVMCGGTAIEYGNAAAVIENPADEYTRALIKAAPEYWGNN